MHTLKVTNSNGDEFTVRIVRQGDCYGLNMCLTHDKDEALIEFYDAEYAHTEYGQFVSRYYASTILTHDAVSDYACGLNLDGGIPKWSIDAEQIRVVVSWLKIELA